MPPKNEIKLEYKETVNRYLMTYPDGKEVWTNDIRVYEQEVGKLKADSPRKKVVQLKMF